MRANSDMTNIWIINRYIPGVSRAIYDTLLTMSEHHKSKRQKYEEEDKELLEKVASRDVTEGLIKQKLSQHVDQVHLFLSTFLSF